jgi:hypothetical protein
MKMFSFFKYSLLLILVSSFIVSCEKETDDLLSEKDGPVVVNYIRLTDPAKSDSLLTSAFMGSLISIVGDNFGDLKQLYFNDQKAILQPNFITDKVIIVNVPTTVPTEVTDKIRMVFSDGSEFLHDFKVNVPAPVLAGIKSEYAPDGGTIELSGDFFFDPKVTFPGDIVGEIVSTDKNNIIVTVPSGVQPGVITVSTNFGKAVSKFIFRDDRNTILNFDDKTHENWTAPTFGTENKGVVPVSGNFAMFSDSDFGEWKWNNPTTMWYFAPDRR